MSTAAVRDVVRQIGQDDPPSDASLLASYLASRDHAAFAELLRRYGPVVLGVCRRLLANRHDAEDAFQAVFLVLVRKAESVQPPGLVGNWLYGVAVRTANKAKLAAARRWRREMAVAMQKPEASEPTCSGELAELRGVIDEELTRLPDHLRAAVVLCDLGGKSRREAARELECPEGTVAARLHRARKLLAERFTKRGIALSSSGLVAAFTPEVATANVSSELARKTLATSVGIAAASPAVQTLASGVMRTMTNGKFKLMLAAVAVAGLMSGAGAIWGANNGESSARAPVAAPVAAPARIPEMAWKEAKTLEQSGWLAGSVAYSADGKRLVVGGTGRVQAYDAGTFKEQWTAKVDGDAQHFAAIAFSPDGKSIAATFADGVRFLAPATGKIEETLEQKGSKPTTVGWFPEDPPAAGEKEHRTRWIVFDSDKGQHPTQMYSFRNWNALSKTGGFNLGIEHREKPRRPAGEVPLAMDPKGRWAVLSSAISDTEKYLLNAHFAKPIGEVVGRALRGHQGTVTSAACSADGGTIVSGDADGVVIAWDAETFEEKSRVELRQRVQAIAVTADGTTCAAATIGPPAQKFYTEQVFTWKTATPPHEPKPIALPRAGGGETFSGVAGLAFSPNGKSLAAAFCDFRLLVLSGQLVGKVRVWQLREPEAKPTPNPDQVAAPGSWREKAVLTDNEDSIISVAFAPDGKTFAAGGIRRGNVSMWDATTHKRIEWFSCNDIRPHPAAVAYSPDSKTLAVTFPDGASWFTLPLKVADPDAKAKRMSEFVKEYGEEGSKPLAVAFGPDQDVRGLKQHRMAFTDGRTLWAKTWFEGAPAGTAKFGPLANPPKVEGPLPAAVAYSPDGKRLVFIPNHRVDGDWIAQVWGGGSGEPMQLLKHGTDPVTAVAWSKDGKFLATGGTDGIVILWDTTTFKELRRIGTTKNRVHELAFSPDGKTLAAAGGGGTNAGQVVLIDSLLGVQVQTIRAFPNAPPSAVAFSPDSRTLLVGCGYRGLDPRQFPLDDPKTIGEVRVFTLEPPS